MALGKIKADTIEHSTAGSLDTSYVVNGSLKSWGVISGDGTTVNDSLNASSFTDTGTGQGYLNFASSMVSGNYLQINFNQWTDFDTGNGAYAVNKGDTETSRCRSLHYENKTLTDPQNRHIMVVGDLA